MTSTSSNPDPAIPSGGRVPVLWTVNDIRKWYAATNCPVLDTTRSSSHIDLASREVSFDVALDALYPVVSRAQTHGPLPLVGSPSWRDLPDGHPRKVGAVYYAALIQTLHMEQRQHGLDEAAEHLAASGMASAAARYRRDLNDFYIQHPDLRRRAS